MDWLGKIVEKLGKPVVWAIGMAFLVMQIAGDRFDILIKDDTILSIWNLLGLVCLVFIFLQIIIYLFNFYRNRIESIKVKAGQEAAEIVKQNQRIENLNSLQNQRIEILNSLSGGQIRILKPFGFKNQRIFHDYEIGGYRAIWQPDMEVLIHKGIVEQISYSTFEINAQYYDLIKEAVKPKEELA